MIESSPLQIKVSVMLTLGAEENTEILNLYVLEQPALDEVTQKVSTV